MQWGLSKNRDIVDETYVIKLIAVVGILTAVILVLANLQTMTDPLILPNPQQSVDKDVEQLRGVAGDVELNWPGFETVFRSKPNPGK